MVGTSRLKDTDQDPCPVSATPHRGQRGFLKAVMRNTKHHNTHYDDVNPDVIIARTRTAATTPYILATFELHTLNQAGEMGVSLQRP